jgi:hypothetical protein
MGQGSRASLLTLQVQVYHMQIVFLMFQRKNLFISIRFFCGIDSNTSVLF